MTEQPILAYPFIRAANYNIASRTDVRLIVIHTMESAEKPGTARAVAQWFAGKTAPKSSAHFCVDRSEVIQCVSLKDIAWHAPGANRTGVGIELAGRAKQSAVDWADDASRETLDLAGPLCAGIAELYRIPVRRLLPTEIRAGERGFCGHNDVTKAFPEKGSGHWDPGPNFPWEAFLARVSAALHPPDAVA